MRNLTRQGSSRSPFRTADQLKNGSYRSLAIQVSALVSAWALSGSLSLGRHPTISLDVATMFSAAERATAAATPNAISLQIPGLICTRNIDGVAS